jgi:hypothetical protein
MLYLVILALNIFACSEQRMPTAKPAIQIPILKISSQPVTLHKGSPFALHFDGSSNLNPNPPKTIINLLFEGSPFALTFEPKEY